MLVEQIQDTDLSCEERGSDSPLIDKVWRSYNEDTTPFTSIAQYLWGMVITKQHGKMTLTIRGPETVSSPAVSPPDAEFVGVLFKVGTLMPQFPARKLMNRADVTLPTGTGNTFWLDSTTWQFPDYDNMEVFVRRLVHEELLQFDPVVADTLQGKPVDLSLRTTQRRFKDATGITFSLVEQIKRARYATTLLKQGTPVLDVVYEAGYSDQPHLIRSLKRFIGLTPQRVATSDREETLSFLFNTPPD